MAVSRYAFLLAATVATNTHAGLGRVPSSPDAEATPTFDATACELVAGNQETSLTAIHCSNTDGSTTTYTMQDELPITVDSNVTAAPELAIVGYGVEDQRVTYYYQNADITVIDQKSCDEVVQGAKALTLLSSQEIFSAGISSFLPAARAMADGDEGLALTIAASQTVGFSAIYANAALHCNPKESAQPPAVPQKKDPSQGLPKPGQQRVTRDGSIQFSL